MLDLIFNLSDKVQYVLAAAGAIIGILGFIFQLYDHKMKKVSTGEHDEHRKNNILYKTTIFLGIILIIISMSIAWIRYDYRIVPNIIGLNIDDANLLLQANDLSLKEVDEEYLDFKIIEQSPKNGTYVKKDTIILGQFLNNEIELSEKLIKADLHLPMQEIKAFIYKGICQIPVASELIYTKPTELYLLDTKNQFKYTEYIISSDETFNEFYVFKNLPEGEYELYVTIPGYRECNIKISLHADMKFDGHWGYWGPYLERDPLEAYSVFSIFVGNEQNNTWYSYENYKVSLSYSNQKLYTELETYTVSAHPGDSFDVCIKSPDEEKEWNGSFTLSDRNQETVKLSLNSDGTISRSYAYSQ